MDSRPPMPALDDLRLFDTCVVAGRVTDRVLATSLTEENILAVLDRHGIQEALVTTNRARLNRPHLHGNLYSVELCRISPRLHPVWVMEPPDEPGKKAARAAVARMRDHGARVARLLMGSGAAAPLAWWWRDTLRALQERCVPCLLDFGSIDYSGGSTQGVPNDAQINWLRDIVRAHPRLPMILSHASGGLGIANSAIPLMQRCSNLHVDTTGVIDYWRRAALEIGPERVFFASAMPYYDPAMLVSNVQYQPGLSVKAKRMICGGNIRRLMENVR